ncbi:MAG: UDP-2-acetamido-2-deoxy-ribo-hexuluronate aminotransferase [Luteibaculaceae bacterium]|jgi:UDP-2-acetamido-2-deoxy-ribo-hexuluronate aminotransferase
MVDLKGQYLKIKEAVDCGIQDVINHAGFINGPEVKMFASELEDFLKVNCVIPCANGTDALQIALMALGLKPGDEVITANFTFASTVEVIGLLGLKPVLVDVDENHFCCQAELIKKAITPKTKAIIPVHIFGQCAPMQEIMAIAKEFGIPVVEDAAQAIGARCLINGEWQYAGTIGDIGTTSFFPSKNLGCYGDGGALFTQDENLGKKLKAITNHGMSKRYYHDEVGVNSRLDSIQAAVLRVKLPLLDSYNAARKKAADYYCAQLKDFPGILVPNQVSYSEHVFHQFTLRILDGKRDELVNYLQNEGVSAMVYYPVPLHQQKAYSQKNVGDDQFPITLKLVGEVCSIPMHTELTEAQQDFIIAKIKTFFK